MEQPISLGSGSGYLYGHFEKDREDKFILAGLSATDSLTIKKLDVKITNIYNFFTYILNLYETFYKTQICRTYVVLKVSESRDAKKPNAINVLASIEEIYKRTQLDLQAKISEDILNNKLDTIYIDRIKNERTKAGKTDDHPLLELLERTGSQKNKFTQQIRHTEATLADLDDVYEWIPELKTHLETLKKEGEEGQTYYNSNLMGLSIKAINYKREQEKELKTSFEYNPNYIPTNHLVYEVPQKEWLIPKNSNARKTTSETHELPKESPPIIKPKETIDYDSLPKEWTTERPGLFFGTKNPTENDIGDIIKNNYTYPSFGIYSYKLSDNNDTRIYFAIFTVDSDGIIEYIENPFWQESRKSVFSALRPKWCKTFKELTDDHFEDRKENFPLIEKAGKTYHVLEEIKNYPLYKGWFKNTKAFYESKLKKDNVIYYCENHDCFMIIKRGTSYKFNYDMDTGTFNIIDPNNKWVKRFSGAH